jgi:hypothetical protein
MEIDYHEVIRRAKSRAVALLLSLGAVEKAQAVSEMNVDVTVNKGTGFYEVALNLLSLSYLMFRRGEPAVVAQIIIMAEHTNIDWFAVKQESAAPFDALDLAGINPDDPPVIEAAMLATKQADDYRRDAAFIAGIELMLRCFEHWLSELSHPADSETIDLIQAVVFEAQTQRDRLNASQKEIERSVGLR